MSLQADLKELLHYSPKPDSPVLTAYLDVDQSYAANLNRKFEVAFRRLLRETESALPSGADRAQLAEDAERMRAFLVEYTPAGRTLVMMADASEGLFWSHNLHVRLESMVRWAPRPFLRPLIEARSEFVRYGVILSDRSQARLFLISLNEIEEDREVLAEYDVRRFDGSGKDRARSQMNFQHQSDTHAHWHLKNVARMMEQLAGQKQFDRLVLAGPLATVRQLESLLSERLRAAQIGVLPLPVDATPQQVLEETCQLVRAHEREAEKKTVERLVTGAAKAQGAVLGLWPTVEAAQAGRVAWLIYDRGFSAAGSECQACGLLFGEPRDSCARCAATAVRPVDDLLERLVEMTARVGYPVEHVEGEAALQLRSEGGIGAFLRF